MRYTLIANHAARAVAAAVIGLCLFVPVAHAQEVKGSHVEVMVCPRGSQSSMSISSPQSDSIVTTPIIRVGGSVRSISQIDFFVDDTYNNTQAVGLGEQAFSSDVALEPGTHTVRLKAIDSCAQESHEDSIVVTYHPQFQPSTGQETQTAIPAAAAGTTSPQADTTDEPAGAGKSKPVASVDSSRPALPPFVARILDELDIGTGAPGADGAPDAAKAASAVAGLLMLAATPFLTLWKGPGVFLSQAASYLLHRPRYHISRSGLHHGQLVLSIFGLLLLFAPFMV
jgi:hypothetical protein